MSKKARREFIDFMLTAPSVEDEDRPEGVHPDSHMVDEQFIGVHLEKVGTKALAVARLSAQA